MHASQYFAKRESMVVTIELTTVMKMLLLKIMLVDFVAVTVDNLTAE